MKNFKLTYRKNGDYFIPNLVLDNDDYKDYQLGKYGYLRLDYLKNYEIDLQAKEKVKLLINQFKANENISEDLKDINPLEWVGLMNNIKNRAEEIVLKKLIYV